MGHKPNYGYEEGEVFPWWPGEGGTGRETVAAHDARVKANRERLEAIEAGTDDPATRLPEGRVITISSSRRSREGYEVNQYRTDEQIDDYYRALGDRASIANSNPNASPGSIEGQIARSIPLAWNQASVGLTDYEILNRVQQMSKKHLAAKGRFAVSLVEGRRDLSEAERLTEENYQAISETYGHLAAEAALNLFTTETKYLSRVEQSASATQVTTAAALIKAGRDPEQAKISILAALETQKDRASDRDRSRQFELKATQRQRASGFGAPQFEGSNESLFAPAHLARRRLRSVDFFAGGLG